MTFRHATVDDCLLLAEMNYQLIRDEGHRNRMTVSELAERMENWLSSGYEAIIFEQRGEVVAYALNREEEGKIYLRHFFVVRNRRRQGTGREAVKILRSEVWPKDKRLVVDVLIHNEAAIAFWRAVGFQDYSLCLEMLPGD